ncbi:MAG: methyl-accepting chemotaxis protein [Nitrospirota bacterium]
MKRTWRRRNYFIKKDLQGKYIFSFFIFVVLGSILFTLIFSLLTSDTLTIVYKNYNVQVGKTPLMLLKEILSAHWIFIVAGGFVVVILSMFLTHRFAGPIYRFEKSVEEMINGNLAFQIRLRSRDEGKELAQKINDLIATLSSRLGEMKKANTEIGRALSETSRIVGEAEGCKEALEQVRKAQGLNKVLAEILSRFKVKE